MPFCSPTFANCIWKDLHALIFDKSLHCAVLFTIFWFCTVCQICQRHCVTCHFWSNILRTWLLAGVSKIVPYLDIAISLWKKWFWMKFKLKWMFDKRIPLKKVPFVTVWHFGSCLDFPILPPQIPSLVPISWFFQHLIHIWQRKKCRTFPYLPHPIVIRD